MIFVDAGAFVARYRKSDDFHYAAVRCWLELEKRRTPCITSSLVLAEAAEFQCQTAGNAIAAGRLRIWLSSDRLLVLRPDSEIELEAADLLDRYKDQRIGFTDCVSFVLMRRKGINSVFGFDRPFRIAGFTLWPDERHP
jgi:hypothetical protein